MSENKHYAGFVNIIGNPNVGKSTLMNAMVGEKMSIITNKPQTTRHRIIGIVNEENHQMVFSDTPGFILDPAYKMQQKMNRAVLGAFEDADVMLWVVDVSDMIEMAEDHPLLYKLNHLECPFFIVFNKMDLLKKDALELLQAQWQLKFPKARIFCISALKKLKLEELRSAMLAAMPESPAYYPKDQLTDKSERFFVSEIIREKILLQYHQEIPYSSEVIVESFQEDEDPARNLVRIRALIFVVRDSQKNIVIGKNGDAIKQLGIAARLDIEKFLDKKVYLELFVKIKDNWRDDERLLKGFGY